MGTSAQLLAQGRAQAAGRSTFHANWEVLAAVPFPFPSHKPPALHTFLRSAKTDMQNSEMNRSVGKALGSPSPSVKRQQMVEALLCDR